MRRPHVVFLVHGIRTRAEYMARTTAALETDPTILVREIKYEYFDLIRFLLPIASVRQRPVDRVLKLIRDEKTNEPERISIIAHSFGTYIISRILDEASDIDLHRVVLCGSIIPDDFEWERHRRRLSPGEWQVVNDCGMADPWPILAKSVTWGYGSSGRFGFGHPRVKDRFHKAGHRDFFSTEFVTNYWLPFLSADVITRGELDRPVTPWWISMLTVVHLKYVLLLVLLIVTVAGGRRHRAELITRWNRLGESITVAATDTTHTMATAVTATTGSGNRSTASDPVPSSSGGDSGWVLANADAEVPPRYGAAGCHFRGKFWIFGGHQGTNSPGTHLNDIYSSQDGSSWNEVLPAAPWTARRGHRAIVHRDAMWISGGLINEQRSPTQYFSDVWASLEGTKWLEIARSAPWGPRWEHGFVSHEDHLWVIGGASPDDPLTPRGRDTSNNDVWKSKDGNTWVRVATAPWAPRWSHATVVYSGKIWVLGGFDGSNIFSDVWYSANGKDWTKVPGGSFPARSGHTVVPLANRLWLFGGREPHELGMSAGVVVQTRRLWTSHNGMLWSAMEHPTIVPKVSDHVAIASANVILIAGGWPVDDQNRSPSEGPAKTSAMWLLSPENAELEISR